MSDALRRSPRLSQQYNATAYPSLPAFSTSSSASTNSQPSPTTDPSQIAAQQDHLRLQLHTQFLSLPQSSGAPLPSPSAVESNPFFGSRQPQSPFTMPDQGQGNTTATHQSQTVQGTLQSAQHHNSFSSDQRPSMPQTVQSQGQGPPPGILAEAAKRAQMACLMRDLGDVTL